MLDGHAIEARVYAEDPRTSSLPSTGTVLGLREPASEGVRATAPEPEVTSDYDPMLAKVNAWGPDRAEALRRLDAALAGTAVRASRRTCRSCATCWRTRMYGRATRHRPPRSAARVRATGAGRTLVRGCGSSGAAGRRGVGAT